MTGKIGEKRGRIMGLKVAGRKDSPANLGVLPRFLKLGSWALGRGGPPAWTKPIAACPARSDAIPTLKLCLCPLPSPQDPINRLLRSRLSCPRRPAPQHAEHYRPAEVRDACCAVASHACEPACRLILGRPDSARPNFGSRPTGGRFPGTAIQHGMFLTAPAR